MGLYDIVRSKKPLPDGYDGELQTKDFDEPYMEHYTIDDDGRLYKEPVRYDNGSGNERHDMNWHGWLDLIGTNLVSYRAKFTDGQFVEFTCQPDDEQ